MLAFYFLLPQKFKGDPQAADTVRVLNSGVAEHHESRRGRPAPSAFRLNSGLAAV